MYLIVCKQMTHVKLNYSWHIVILGTISMGANKWIILDRSISVSSNTCTHLTVCTQISFFKNVINKICVYKSYILRIQGSLNKFLDVFRVGTFIDSTHIKLYSPSKESPPAAMHLLYCLNNFWKAPWKSSCLSVAMTFVTASFISSIAS